MLINLNSINIFNNVIDEFTRLLKSSTNGLVSYVEFSDEAEIETLYEAVYTYTNSGRHSKDDLYYLDRILSKLKKLSI